MMKNNKTNTASYDPKNELTVKETEFIYLHETGKWAKFLSVVGFIISGLIVLCGLIMIVAFRAISAYSDLPFAGSFLGLIYIGMAVLYFFPCLYLYRFADKMGKALKEKDQSFFTASLKNQKSLFKFMGIMTIVVLALYALLIIIAVIAGVVYAVSLI